MKKSTLSILLLSIICYANAQVKDTISSENKVNGEWVKNGINIITSNEECITVSDLFQVWDAYTMTYVNSTLATFTYDETGDVIQIITQQWDAFNNAWVNNGKTTYTFSNDDLYFTNIGQAWDATNNRWINNYRILVEYNADETIKRSEFDYSDGINWLKQARTSYTYDAEKRQKTFLYQVYFGNSWLNASRATYDYTGNGLSHSYYWDSFSQQWMKSQRSFNQYKPNTTLVTKQLYQSYTGIDWLNQSRMKNAYNENNMILNTLSENFDATLQQWNNGFRVLQTYYEDGSQRRFIFESWDAVTNTWNYGYRANFTNNACGTTLEFSSITETLNQGKAIDNKTERLLNLQLSNGRNTVYDVLSAAGQKQFSFRLTQRRIKKQQAMKVASSNDLVKKDNKALISPNPAKSYFAINLSGYTSQVIVKLMDVSGKHILQQKLQGGSVQNISLPNLQKGIYIVSLVSGKNVTTHKLMVE